MLMRTTHFFVVRWNRFGRRGVVMVVLATIGLGATGCGGDKVQNETIEVGYRPGENPYDYTVDETDIVITEGSDVLRVGGLDVVIPGVGRALYSEPPSKAYFKRNVDIPRNWPGLSAFALFIPITDSSPSKSDPSFDEDAPAVMTFVAVLGQTGMLVDPARRSEVFSEVATYNEWDEANYYGEVGDAQQGNACYVSVHREDGNDYRADAVLIGFAGPEIASSLLIVENFTARNPANGYDFRAWVSAILTDTCGAVPEGFENADLF